MTVAVDLKFERPAQGPVWSLSWLTPLRCRIVFAAVVLLGVAGHVWYLNHDCPIDLSGDEAQYWDWSRQLDLSYYSKGPLVAYIIRASCAMFGQETMPVVRYPAILCSVGVAIITYLLTVKLFKSERLALGAVLLNHLVPMFVAGSVLMTIDPPLFLFWSCATYFAAVALFDQKRWAWIIVGIFVGLGFLAKYAMFLWLPSIFLFAAFDASTRKWRGPLIATIIALLFSIPVILWNYQHGWVSLKHVAAQTGAAGGSARNGNFFEFIGAQIGIVGIVHWALILGGLQYAHRHAMDPHRRQLQFLIFIGLPFFLLTMVTSLLAKVQPNWPAPAYFTLFVLAAFFLSTRLEFPQRWKPWRGWIYGTIIISVIAIPIVHDESVLFPLLSRLHVNPASIDYLSRLRGWHMLGNHVSGELQSLGPNSFVLCDEYMQVAEMAFYVDGQPKTYYAGSYYVSDPKRLTQYDMWPDRSLEATVDGKPNRLLGRNAIYVGKGGPLPPDMPAAFERMVKLPEIPVIVGGVEVHSFKIWRCYGFKGMSRPAGAHEF